MRITEIALSLACVTITYGLFAAQPEEAAPPKLLVSLVDGSRIMGQTTVKTLPVNGSAVGRLVVPLDRIKSVAFGRDRQPSTVTMRNGDRLQGTVELETLPMQTIFGKAAIRVATITQLDVLASSRPAGENLLENGSFEEGPEVEPGSSLPMDPGNKQLRGWEITRGQIDYCNEWEGSDGKSCLDLNGTPGIGGVAQKFETIPGRHYRVKFMMAGNPAIPRITTLRVSAAGQSKEFSFDTSGKNRTSHMGWVTNVWTFTAEESTTTLEIYSTDHQSDREGPMIDDISATLDDR